MSAPAPGRTPCPVSTCTNFVPAGQVMCATCWGVLPQYQRVSVDATMRACHRQNTKPNQARVVAARKSAILLAASLRS